ncbi:hypothetical protein SADUNF_Sadunf02G0141700 [Salix dunnii]|uniref:Uncharacterized protein n=1 Tax=Salix dunnii TaxID=1413687 RepID=A0A835N866_9ROSI|nr:hypothetical protein SADUNF_Sadunf02G0141700 [Salix dunnii]
MSYEFSGPLNPGPNAPFKRIHFTLLLTGNRGARALVGGAIAGIEYLSSVEKLKPKLQWEKNSGEDFFLYIDDEHINHAVFFSTRSSARGAGISIREIRQGLDYYIHMITNSSSHFHVSGNEWQRHPFPMPRQQLPPLKAHQQQPAFTEDKAFILCFTFHPIILRPTISV